MGCCTANKKLNVISFDYPRELELLIKTLKAIEDKIDQELQSEFNLNAVLNSYVKALQAIGPLEGIDQFDNILKLPQKEKKMFSNAFNPIEYAVKQMYLDTFIECFEKRNVFLLKTRVLSLNTLFKEIENIGETRLYDSQVMLFAFCQLLRNKAFKVVKADVRKEVCSIFETYNSKVIMGTDEEDADIFRERVFEYIDKLIRSAV